MFSSLLAVYASFGLRYVAPLIALPYLANTLSSSTLAIYLTVQSIGLMGGAGIEYGFGMWASRELAGAHAASEVSTIAAGVLSAQALLILIVCPVVIAAAILTPGLSVIAALASGALAIVSGFSPAWYFQGRLQAQWGALIECAAALAYLGLLLLLVHSSTDLPQALASMVLGPAIAYSIGLLQVLRETKIRCFRADLGWACIRVAFTMFSTRAAVLVYTSTSTWMMFVLGDPTATAQYGIANRLAGPVLGLYAPLAQVLLPRFHRRALALGSLTPVEGIAFVGILEVSAAIAIAACHFFSHFFTTKILMIPVPGVAEAVNGLSWMLLPIAASQALVLYFILPNKKEAWNLRSILAGAGIFVLAAPPLVLHHAVTGMILARLLGETTVTAGLLIGSILVWRSSRVVVHQDPPGVPAPSGAVRGD